MTTLNINKDQIPNLDGKVAIVTGGASGIGLAAVKLLLEKNATVHIMDIADPDEEDWEDWPRLHVHKVDVRVWIDLSDAFAKIDVVDYVFANAGLGGLDDDLLVDNLDKTGRLKEPKYLELDTNIRGVFNTNNITINGVAAGATVSKMLPYEFAVPLIKGGIGINTAESTGLALVYSAVASQKRRVEVHGRESVEKLKVPGRWNGRIILALGDRYREIEEVLADTREIWFGKQFCKWTIMQQVATDFRGSEGSATDSQAE
ncbi:hypothetical protein SLS53_009064 [Cytospora paraplurivora]|uniref:Uncharacterized protein n=1 Tax=Cytospora paraplurivora TaxID=2898453 RepID=A0AAN9YBF1_9PEZI